MKEIIIRKTQIDIINVIDKIEKEYKDNLDFDFMNNCLRSTYRDEYNDLVKQLEILELVNLLSKEEVDDICMEAYNLMEMYEHTENTCTH